MAITVYELERRLTTVERSFQRIQDQIDRVEKLFEHFRGHVSNCFEEIFQRLDSHDRQFIVFNTRLANIEQNMVSQSDLAAMQSRLKDFILNAFQKPLQ